MNCLGDIARLIAIFMMVALPALGQNMFPLAKGTTWVYSARVKWGSTLTSVGGVKTLRWTSTVADSFRKAEVEVALLHGGPWDLAWYTPNVRAKDYLVVRAADTYYLVRNDARAMFSEIKAGKIGDLGTRLADDVWFKVPMQISDDFCAPQQEGTAPFNCWSVEKITKTHLLRIAGYRPGASETEYFLAFLSNPDTTTLTLVPGAGIVTYFYEHHGTVAEASVKLIEIHAPGTARTRVAPPKRASKTSKVK